MADEFKTINMKCSECGLEEKEEKEEKPGSSNLRPYGENGALICFKCGYSAKNKERTITNMVDHDAEKKGIVQTPDKREFIITMMLALTPTL